MKNWGYVKKIVNGLTTYIVLIRLKSKGVVIKEHPRFCGLLHYNLYPSSKVQIGANCIIVSGGYRNEIGRNSHSLFTVYENAMLKIGDFVSMSDVSISCRKSVTIGNHVTIGGDVLIIDSNAHCLDWSKRRQERAEYQNFYHAGEIVHRPIIIEDDVFIGTKTIITKGVTIGARSIIAAGSVVVCNVPPDEIWGGNPAKFIKKIAN